MATDDDFTVVEPGTVPVVDEALERDRHNVLRWLQPTDYLSPGNEYMKHLHAYMPGTGKWVQESPIFRSWRGEDMSGDAGTDTESGYHRIAPASVYGASCLHVRGVAGSGKSVFSASTIDQLQTAGHLVLFFFFRQIVDKNHAAKYLVRDFAAQLLQHSDSLVRELASVSQGKPIDTFGHEELWRIVAKTITEGRVRDQVFCVVDALDEMDDEDFPDMMERLLTLGFANPQAVKVMLTGRPLPKIERAVQDKPVVQLKLDPALLSPDVARYVDARMAALDPRLSDERSELVRQAICKRASGLFLHARLITDNLAQSLQDGTTTEETLPDSLDRLPRSLREVYEEMLQEHARRSGVSSDHQAKILTCVTHSSRPLRLIELGSLVAHMLDVDLRRGKELVRGSCGRLLELLEDETVSVIHHSFTEFLHDGNRKAMPNSFPVIGGPQAHDELASICLEYLDKCPHFDAEMDEERETNYDEYDFSLPERDRRDEIRTQLRLNHPLADYAAHNLAFHFKRAGKSASRGLSALDAYFQPRHPAFETWALIHWKGGLLTSLNAMVLLIAAEKGESMPLAVIKHIAETHPLTIDAPGPDGQTPLHHAASRGDGDVVLFLLEKGANPETDNREGMTALHLAISSEKLRVAQILLEAGMDPRIKTLPVSGHWDTIDHCWVSYSEEKIERLRTTAASQAIRGESLEIMMLFMPFLPPEEATTYFHGAKTAQTVEAILATGLVDINSYIAHDEYRLDEFEKTKLYVAAAAGDLDMVKVLLQHGANPNQREPNQPGPLHGVAGVGYFGHIWSEGSQDEATELVRVLVDAGADLEARADGKYAHDNKQFTPLHQAVSKREFIGMSFGKYDQSEEIITLALLKAGADANAVTAEGNTPLHLANPKKLQLIETLVKHGANIDQPNAGGRSPFLSRIRLLECENSDEKSEPEEVCAAVMHILDLGADATRRDTNGRNAMHFLMSNLSKLKSLAYMPLVERVTKLVDANQKDKEGNAPVFSYNEHQGWGRLNSSGNEEPFLQLLVDSGLQLDVRNSRGIPFLHHLLHMHNSKVKDLEMFIRLGADPDVRSLDGVSLFHSAVRSSSSPEWLEYLLSVCKHPYSTDKDGNSIIHEILIHGDERKEVEGALRLVVADGADPLTLNNKGQSVLHVAASGNVKFALGSSYFHQLDINRQDTDGLAPLHRIAAFGQDLVLDALERGADPFSKSKSGLLPLHTAAQAGQPEVLGLLIGRYESQPALVSDINSLGDGKTPLHYACQAGSHSAVSVLLRAGADPTLVDSTGYTPLHALSKYVPTKQGNYVKQRDIRTPEIVRSLCRYKADLEATVACAGGASPATPLELAITSKRWEVVRELLDCGAICKSRDPEVFLATDKDAALAATQKIMAAMENELAGLSEDERLQRLCCSEEWRGRWASCEDPPQTAQNWILGPSSIRDPPESHRGGAMPTTDVLVAALSENDFDSIMEYHEQGGNLLDTARLAGGYPDFLQYLIQHGYEHHLRLFADEARRHTRMVSAAHHDPDGRLFASTLLGFACQNSAPSMPTVEWLVEEIGANVNASHLQPTFGSRSPLDTALHSLARGKSFWHLEAIKYLLSKGADIEARTHCGLTPFMSAFDQEDHREQPGRWRIDAARILLEHGADPNAQTQMQPGDWSHLVQRGSNISALGLTKRPDDLNFLLSVGVKMTGCNDYLISTVREEMEVEPVAELLKAGFGPNEEPSSVDEHREPESDHFGKLFIHYALHEAARPSLDSFPDDDLPERKTAVTKLLLSHGADPYSTYPDGSFVLQRIVEDRGLALLCLSFIEQLDVDRRGNAGRTLLIQACIPGYAPNHAYKYNDEVPVPAIMADVVTALLEEGADVTLRDETGRTALHWACTQDTPFDEDYREALRALVETNPSIIHIADNDGRLPQHLALEALSRQQRVSDFALQRLMDAGADLSILDPVSGDSALHHIARALTKDEPEDTVDAKAFFREMTASLDINAQNHAGESVVAAAIGSPYPDSKRFYSSGYPEKVESTYAKTLRFVAKLGAKLDAVDHKGRNLLHVAADREINDERCNGWGTESRMIQELFIALLDRGVNPRHENNDLRTPIDVVVARGFNSVVKLFSEEGKRAAEERKVKRDAEGSDFEDD